MTRLLLLCALSFLCACTPLRDRNRNVGPEVWNIYIDPDLKADPDLIMVFLDDFYLEFRISFIPSEVDPGCAVPRASQNWLCIYAKRAKQGRLGMAILDPGNRYHEINCGPLGVFGGSLTWRHDAAYRIAQVAAHEIGHSLGLAHPEIERPGNIMNAHFRGIDTVRFSDADRDYLLAVLGAR